MTLKRRNLSEKFIEMENVIVKNHRSFTIAAANRHDFPSLADGVLVPHGIFDVTQNKGYISLGHSKDTLEF